ncbi:MAG TPA: TraB/GumN family protein [Luteimonas sp.]|nr:TraB/GumN family protein [Luteimonas sp.]
MPLTFCLKVFAACCVLALVPCAAQDPAPGLPAVAAGRDGPERKPVPPPTIVQLDTVTVTGLQPGPGLWRVSKGDHQLWILGSLSPRPDRISWDSGPVRERVAASQQVLLEPKFVVDMDVGLFKMATLGIRFHQAQKNPDGQTLEDVLPADVYARWQRARQQYMPRNGGVERKRPLVAADDLLDAALQRNGLTDDTLVEPEVIAEAKSKGIKVSQPQVTTQVEDPRAALQEAAKISLNDVQCLVATLDAIDQDLPRIVTNANAWAIGDIERVSFAQLERRDRLCSDAFSGAEFARKRGIPNLRTSSMQRWLDAADVALHRNASTFGVVPLEDIVAIDGYAARLAAKGYTVEAP